jgi:hypothetical protein
VTTKYCALCLHIRVDQDGSLGRPDLPDSSVEITTVNGHSSCARHFAYLRFARPLDESAAIARADDVVPSWSVSP